MFGPYDTLNWYGIITSDTIYVLVGYISPCHPVEEIGFSRVANANIIIDLKNKKCIKHRQFMPNNFIISNEVISMFTNVRRYRSDRETLIDITDEMRFYTPKHVQEIDYHE